MEFMDYLHLRVKNGKITDLKYPGEASKRQHPDLEYVREFGKNMVEFWENATSQKDLLWAMRGLGMDSEADMLWGCISKSSGITPHSKLTEEQALENANFIRSVNKNHFKLLPSYVWNGDFIQETISDNSDEIAHVHFKCPVCDDGAGTSIYHSLQDHGNDGFSCEECNSEFEMLPNNQFRIIRIK